MPLVRVLSRLAERIVELILGRPEDPHEYAMVRAPVRPKKPTLSAKAAVVPEPE